MTFKFWLLWAAYSPAGCSVAHVCNVVFHIEALKISMMQALLQELAALVGDTCPTSSETAERCRAEKSSTMHIVIEG